MEPKPLQNYFAVSFFNICTSTTVDNSFPEDTLKLFHAQLIIQKSIKLLGLCKLAFSDAMK